MARARKRYDHKSNIRHDLKIAAWVVGGAAVLGVGYYFYQKSQTASPQLPPSGGTPTGG